MAHVVIDTNVLVSALIGHGKPRRLVRRLFASRSTVYSKEMLAELSDVLARGKFSLTTRQINRFLSLYVRRSGAVALNRLVTVVTDDPDDDTVLSTAINGRADYIVTGDKHLLILKEFDGVQIVTVDRALRILSDDGT